MSTDRIEAVVGGSAGHSPRQSAARLRENERAPRPAEPASDRAASQGRSVPQYSLARILGMWAGAAGPMGALAWVVAPSLGTELPPGGHDAKEPAMHPLKHRVLALGAVLALLGSVLSAAHPGAHSQPNPAAGTPTIAVPATPVGGQLAWVLAQLNGGAATLTISSWSSTVKQARVTITWRSGGRSQARSKTLTTLITDGGIAP